jgi:hypothetical protein
VDKRAQQGKSALGQSRPKWLVLATSVFPQCATRQRTSPEVRLVPYPDLCTAAFWPSMNMHVPHATTHLFLIDDLYSREC